MSQDACSPLFEFSATGPPQQPVFAPATQPPIPDSSALFKIPLDTQSIPQQVLNIEAKTRSNLLPWNGQFSPQLVSALLDEYAHPGGLVVDPFVGSGTVLAEASRCELPAFGADINPAAYHMAALYTLANVRSDCRHQIMQTVTQHMEADFERCSLFRAGGRSADEHVTKQRLVARWCDAADPCERRLLAALIVLLDFYKNGLTPERVLSTYRDLRVKLAGLPYSSATISVVNADARSLPLADGSANLVLCSPPYINVFNYHQQFRKSAEALGWNLLHVARSEIGSNRRNRANRFLTVIEYCLDMTAVLSEIRRICEPHGRIILVVGRESRVRKTPFFNAEIVLQLATSCGSLRIRSRQERVFRNRFGEAIYEDILHFSPGPALPAPRVPRDIAREALTAALDRAPREAQSDLKAAIAAVGTLGPSPRYFPDNRKAL